MNNQDSNWKLKFSRTSREGVYNLLVGTGLASLSAAVIGVITDTLSIYHYGVSK